MPNADNLHQAQDAGAMPIPARWFTVAPSVSRTATAYWEFENSHGSGLIVNIVSTASSVTPSVVFKISGVDPVTGAVWDILTSVAVTDGSTTKTLQVGIGVTAAANLAISALVPARIRITATHADADPITYSIGATLTA